MPAGSADSSMEAPRHGEGHAFEAASERAAPACHRLPACRRLHADSLQQSLRELDLAPQAVLLLQPEDD